MRRFAVLIAIYGVCISSWATAAPFEQLSGRVQQYDEETDTAPRSPRRDRQASYQEEIPAGNDGQGEYDQGEYVDQGPPRGMNPWDPPAAGCAGGGCGNNGCNSCCNWLNCSPGRFWGRAEYLYWWVRGANTPPLVTTSPDNTPQAQAGILPNASILFGDQRVNSNGRSGGRFTLGYWFDDCETMGVEGAFLFLGNATQGFSASSGGSPILARPFFNTLTGNNDADLVAFPNIVTGTVGVTTFSKIAGAEVNIRRALYADDFRRVDILAGYRFFYLNEGLRVDTHTTSIDQQSTIPVGTTFAIFDSFETTNRFNGGQLGLNTHFYNGRWTFDLLGKVALGAVSQRVTINGGTTVAQPAPAVPVSNSGGILALGSNIGTFNRTQFGVLPEFGANLHYQISPLWRVNLGYTLLILTNVVRPGDQVDTHVDPNQFPPPVASGTFPAFAFHNSTVWLQGINVGLECNF